MKRVLFLSYYFPPRNRISSYRAAGFCRHLPGFDWEPVVICEDWPTHAPDYDEQLLSGLEEVETHRIQSYGPRGFNRFLIRNVYPWVFPHKTPYNWWKIARQRAIELCAANSFKAILATHDPLPTLSLASELSSRFGIPWVADLRDSWNMHKLSSPRKQRLIASHEKRLAGMANEVVSVSGEMSDELARILNRPVQTISNGFDAFSSSETEKPCSEIFSILYAGNVTLRRQDPMGLLQAVQKCVSEGRIPAELIQVNFLGASPDALRSLDRKKINDVPICFEPRVTRRQALDRMASSTILWVLAHKGEKGVMTGKVFDYLGSGRPILSAPDDGGEINGLLHRTKAGFSLTDPNEIAWKLEKWFGQWQENRFFQLNVNQNEVLKHSRERKTEELVRVLDSLC